MTLLLALLTGCGGAFGDPCTSDLDCAADLECVDWSDLAGDVHLECGVSCQSDADCPDGMACQFWADGPYEICG